MNLSHTTRVCLIAFAFALMAGPVMAQQAGNGGNGGNNGQPGAGQQQSMQLRLFYELNLDEAQTAEVQAIIEAARALHVEERARFLANIEAIRGETHGAIMAVLDEAQQQRFLELQELRGEQWAEGGRGGMNGRNGNGNGAGNGNGGGGGNGPGTGDCTNPDCPNPDCPNADTPDGGG